MKACSPLQVAHEQPNPFQSRSSETLFLVPQALASIFVAREDVDAVRVAVDESKQGNPRCRNVSSA